MRTKYQGVLNIVKFNWHFYFLASLLIAAMIVCSALVNQPLSTLLYFGAHLAFIIVVVSLVVSYYIYDHSDLYSFPFLEDLSIKKDEKWANIHAGFDETSAILAQKYTDIRLSVLDFYDAKIHTEVSIKRARKAYPPYPNTLATSSDNIVQNLEQQDKILLIFAAHEIRTEEGRTQFFLDLATRLKPTGKIILTEHFRDLQNTLAYTFGVFHFIPKSSWLRSISDAQLHIASAHKTTPFITTLILEKHGTDI